MRRGRRYTYSPRGDLTVHDWDYAGTANDAAFDFNYNGVGQYVQFPVAVEITKCTNIRV